MKHLTFTPADLWSRSKRFYLAATFFALLALKFRATLAAGIDLPSNPAEWLFPSGLASSLVAWNGQWDPFVLRLVHSVFEAGIAAIWIGLIARCCRPSNGGGWAVLINGGIQVAIASVSIPPLVESWRQPWLVGLLCGTVLTLGLIRKLRIAVLAAFILTASAAWWCGPLRPPPPELSAPGDPRGAAVRDYLSNQTFPSPIQPHPTAGVAEASEAFLPTPGQHKADPLPARTPAERETLTEALADPQIRARLPLAARPVLPLNQPIQSKFAFVAISARRTGELALPAAVVLQTANEEKIAALQGALPPDREWHRLNLPIPEGTFQIIAEGPLETGPAVEYSAGSRDAGKLLRLWPACAGLAVICLLGGTLSLTIPNERRGWKLAWTLRERRLLPWLALIAYAGALGPFLDTYAGGSDSAGYLGSARLLQHFQLTAPVPQPADLGAGAALPPSGFLPRGFALKAAAGAPSAIMVPTYPVGLPLLFCLALWSLPAAVAIPAVILFHLLAGPVLTYLAARHFGLPHLWSLGAAAFLALSPLYIFMGLQPMSDVPALVWVTGAVVLALSARHRSGIAACCGVATAIAVLIRPSNAIALPVIAAALPLRPRALIAWIAGGLPFAVLLALYNHQLYGHPLLTGYGRAGGLFSAQWIGPTLLHYGAWLPLLLSPAAAAILVLPFRPRIAPVRRWIICIWAGLFLAIYSTYSCTHETWWYLRFVLPAFPAFIIGALLVLRDWAIPRPAYSQGYLLAATAAVGIALWLLVADTSLDVLQSGRGNAVYEASSRWLEQQTPNNALVVCSYSSGALYYYSPNRVFFQPAAPAEAAAVTAAARAGGRPLYAEFFRFDQQPLAWFTGGRWEEVHRSGDIIIWRWVASA